MTLLPKAQDTMTRVLIVDDNNYNLDICHEYIASGGYDAICADGGISGLQYLEQHNDEIDLILLDSKMPIMDGAAMLKRLQADTRFKDIPVVIVSAELDQEIMSEGKRAGVSGYVTKPFSRKELLIAVDSALNAGYKKSAAI